MSDKEILEKAIRVAIKNGFGNKGYDWLDTAMSDSFDMDAAPGLIFNHGFARALWGDDPIYNQQGSTIYFDPLSKAWKIHLQQMVIAPDPIKYLGEHLND